MNSINAVLDFCAKVALTTFSHLVWLLGSIFVFGLLLFLCARFTRTCYVKSAGYELGVKLDIIATGWIGTPVHELGHALFCVLFRHRIIDMKLYSPDPEEGTLGYVAHDFNPRSRFQKIGNFFIGIGPILFGAVVLYALMYYLMPGMIGLFSQVQEQSAGMAEDINTGRWLNLWNAFYASSASVLGGIFDARNFLSWKFWIFLYLSFCIASHMELSPPDIKGAQSGLLTFVITILALNLAVIGVEVFGLESFAGSYWQYIKLETYAPYINSFLGSLSALLSYALVISALNFVLSYIGLSIYTYVKYKTFFNPFWV
jgi:hypothetical protein